MKVKVRCIQTYKDKELLTDGNATRITPSEEDKNYERIVSEERANVLVSAGVCEIVEHIEEVENEVEEETTDTEQTVEEVENEVEEETTDTEQTVEEVENAKLETKQEQAIKKTTQKKKVQSK